MTDEIDMWNDIERLEKQDKKKADVMMKVFHAYFLEGDEKSAKDAIKEAWEKYPNFKFNFDDYGIPLPRVKKKLKKVV